MKKFIICICMTFFIVDIGFSQGRINKAENSLNNRESKNWDSDSDNSWLFVLFYYPLEALVFSYYVIIGPDDGVENKTGEVFITNYPYKYTNKGNYTYNIEEDISHFRTEISGRYLFGNRSLKGMHLTSSMRFFKRLELEIDYHQLWENSVNYGNDKLAIYNMLLQYHRVRFEKFDAWWGIGASHVAGDVNRYGFTYSLGSEFFFVKPVSAEINFNQTFINSETVNKFNALLNYHVNQCKVTVGYENLKIGTQNFSMMTFGGAVFF